MGFDWALALWLLLVAVIATCLGAGTLVVLQSRQNRAGSPLFLDDGKSAVFLFDGETLVDATPGARALLAASPARGAAWHRLLAFLAPRFPGLEPRLARLAVEGRFALASADVDRAHPLVLEAEWRGGMARIAVADADCGAQVPILDPLSHRAAEEELSLLRAALAQAPLLVWRENAAAEVVWANAAYLAIAEKLLEADQDLPWPLPRLATPGEAAHQRLRLDGAGAPPDWYDVTSFPDAGGRLVFALPAGDLVRAEVALHDFTQTLTKTFAHLPIGLAIFNRQRQLALFNPALLDLTGLPADFLAARPTLFAFLDMLRDRKMIPEPKNYRSWRRQMADLERAAASGRYEETWNLSGGQTFRVIGRPHPDGAMALLIEDISSEMIRSRRHRADVELGQSVIDAMEEAVAVFSPAGILVMSNAAYARLWCHDPAATLGEAGVAAIVAHWRAHSAASPIWAKAEQLAVTLGDRQPWSGEARLNDGRLVACRFVPLTGGATMFAFRPAIAAADTGADMPAVRFRHRG